jgi:sigma-B regulation protein RsbU (phosphoserine phosphatase)
MNCQTRVFTYGRAGHELPLLVDVHGEIYQVEKHAGQPLALFDDPDIDEGNLELPSEGMLMLYTDGVTDAVDAQGAFFGSDRMLRIMQSDFQLSAQTLCSVIWDELNTFRGEVVQHDDVTLVAVKMKHDA